MHYRALPLVILLATACRVGDGDTDDENGEAVQQDARVASAYATGSDRLSYEEIEAGRLDMDWREFIERDTTEGAAADTMMADSLQPAGSEAWDEIAMETVNSGPAALPLYGDVEGPSVLRVQVLLDRALFSPGVIDGRWGRNTEKAVYWMQRREGIRPSGRVDEATWERLQQLAGQPGELVRAHTLTADDVSGPFVSLPAEYYDRRDMDCQCYESLGEKLAEKYHTTEDLLRKLNPDADLNSVSAGTRLNVPAVERTMPDSGTASPAPQAGTVAKVVISDGGKYLHALDASGRVLYHFPATLGSDYSPSPSETLTITNVAHDPSWHYQPDILAGVDDDEPDAVLPAGPNNAVGVVWMALSKEHYGIHGTSAPETIGYATSNGCVRLTNWDAEFLGQLVQPGTTVEFRDVR